MRHWPRSSSGHKDCRCAHSCCLVDDPVPGANGTALSSRTCCFWLAISIGAAIGVHSSNIVKIVNNDLLDVSKINALGDPNLHGIRLQESHKVNVINNTIINDDVETDGANEGITAGSAPTTDINCIGNTIVGFPIHIREQSCDNEIGNNLL